MYCQWRPQMMSFTKLRKEFVMGMLDGLTVPFGFSDLERWMKSMKIRRKFFKRFQAKPIIHKENKYPLYKFQTQGVWTGSVDIIFKK